jgi:hypothetical protein
MKYQWYFLGTTTKSSCKFALWIGVGIILCEGENDLIISWRADDASWYTTVGQWAPGERSGGRGGFGYLPIAMVTATLQQESEPGNTLQRQVANTIEDWRSM